MLRPINDFYSENGKVLREFFFFFYNTEVTEYDKFSVRSFYNIKIKFNIQMFYIDI